MITAHEAYKEAMDVREVEAQAELAKIEQLINRCKSKGELHCVTGVISDNLVKKLEGWGYKVNVDFDKNETYVTINWDLSKNIEAPKLP